MSVIARLKSGSWQVISSRGNIWCLKVNSVKHRDSITNISMFSFSLFCFFLHPQLICWLCRKMKDLLFRHFYLLFRYISPSPPPPHHLLLGLPFVPHRFFCLYYVLQMNPHYLVQGSLTGGTFLQVFSPPVQETNLFKLRFPLRSQLLEVLENILNLNGNEKFNNQNHIDQRHWSIF